MGSSGSRCTKRYLEAKKKEKNNNKKKGKKTKQEIGHNFLIDFLFFIPHEKKICIYPRKMDRPQNWLKMIGWKSFWLKK